MSINISNTKSHKFPEVKRYSLAQKIRLYKCLKYYVLYIKIQLISITLFYITSFQFLATIKHLASPKVAKI